MQYKDNQLILPQKLYANNLETINGVRLSKREVDIIACILNGRSAKGIAHFLSLSPRTVETHLHNAMKKLGCTSRENLISFLEKTEKLLILKTYYFSLLTYSAFEKALRDIAKQGATIISQVHCLIVYWDRNAHSFFQNLKTHLELAGIVTSLEAREQEQSFSQLLQETHEGAYTIYALPDSLEGDPSDKETLCTPSQSPDLDKTLFLVPETASTKTLSFSHIYLANQKNYYSLVFSILTKILLSLDLTKIIAGFQEKNASLLDPSQMATDKADGKEKNLGQRKGFISVQEMKLWLSQKGMLFRLFSAVLLVSVGLLAFQKYFDDKGSTGGKYNSQYESEMTCQPVRSDLVVPVDSLLLNRVKIIYQMEGQLEKQKEGIKTIALVGIGGAGKTTLARQYAQSQKRSTMWEFNAETPRSLKDSFEKMAAAIAEITMDHKTFLDIQKINPFAEREEKILQFVKKYLKQHPYWVLIYDQSDDLAGAPQYFPRDTNSWGYGKVILTTRNFNIQNDKQINHVINVNELTPEEKLNLFIKIVTNGNEDAFPIAQKEEAKNFLKEIPPFPLDISIAAYYLKATGTSYEKYLEHLNDYNQYVDITQENILQGTGDYKNTRYKIISLSFRHLLTLHPDYGDLLLFVSLLDSQNIPRNLLDSYKNDAIVDNFIYHLKKQSLIAHEEPFHLSNSMPTFSMHSNTHKINRSYLLKTLYPEKYPKLLQSITHALENFILDVVNREDILEMSILIKHCETFLSHQNLLTEVMTTSVKGALGYMYFYLGDYTKANQLIESSLKAFNHLNIKHDLKIAQLLGCLGNIHKERNEPKKSIYFLDQSLIIYNTSFSERHNEIAQTISSLGEAYKDLGNYEKAKELLEQSLSIYRKYPTKNPIGLARSLACLGDIYMCLGQYQKAKNLLNSSLGIFTKVSYGIHIKISKVLVYLGALEYRLGNIKGAQYYLEKSLENYEKYLPKNHIYIAWNLAYLGNVHRLLKNYPQALNYIEKSISIYQQHFTKDHAQLAWALKILAKIYRDSGDYQKAHSLLEKILAVYKDHYGPNHIKVAHTLRTMGKVYFLEENDEMAKKLFSESLKIYEKCHHPEMFNILEILAELLFKESKKEINSQQAQILQKEAFLLLTQALEVAKPHFLEGSPHVSRIELKLKRYKRDNF